MVQLPFPDVLGVAGPLVVDTGVNETTFGDMLYRFQGSLEKLFVSYPGLGQKGLRVNEMLALVIFLKQIQA